MFNGTLEERNRFVLRDGLCRELAFGLVHDTTEAVQSSLLSVTWTFASLSVHREARSWRARPRGSWVERARCSHEFTVLQLPPCSLAVVSTTLASDFDLRAKSTGACWSLSTGARVSCFLQDDRWGHGPCPLGNLRFRRLAQHGEIILTPCSGSSFEPQRAFRL